MGTNKDFAEIFTKNIENDSPITFCNDQLVSQPNLHLAGVVAKLIASYIQLPVC